MEVEEALGGPLFQTRWRPHRNSSPRTGFRGALTGTSYNTRAKTKRGTFHRRHIQLRRIARHRLCVRHKQRVDLAHHDGVCGRRGSNARHNAFHRGCPGQHDAGLHRQHAHRSLSLPARAPGQLRRTALDQILADKQLSTGNTYFAATDNQGTVRDLLEYDSETSTTSVESHLAYTPFGDLDRPDSTGLDVATVNFLFGYIGAWTDPATGLQYHQRPRHRHRRPLARPGGPTLAQPRSNRPALRSKSV